MTSSDLRPFKAVARELFEQREEFLTQTGNINWMAVADQLPGVHYETLRKAAAGDRTPTPQLMESLAELAGAEPTVFAEYQLYLFLGQFDIKKVGWEAAMSNLRDWAEKSARGRKPRR